MNSISTVSVGIGSGSVNCFSDLAVALIKFCVQDGDSASKEISERLSAMQSQVNEAKALLEKSSDSENTAVVTEALNGMSSEIMNAVIALQFFDRISQRMEHAVESVEVINDASSEKAETLLHRFTMDDERILYDALLEGCSVEEALNRANQRLDDTIESNGSDIELF